MGDTLTPDRMAAPPRRRFGSRWRRWLGLGLVMVFARDRDGPFRRSLVDRVARSAAVGGGACILHPGGGPRWKAAAALHHAGRALAVARRPRTGRSAVSATAARLRGQALLRAHRGVDPLALGRACTQLLESRPHHLRRLDHHDAGRTPARTAHRAPLYAKLRQMVRALELEVTLSKDEILALYLSLAPYGGNLEGVRAASLAYFGKEPRRLTLGEAAMLVALPQSPEQRRPDRFRERGAQCARPGARSPRVPRASFLGTRLRARSTNRCRTAASRCQCSRRTRPTPRSRLRRIAACIA